MANSSATNTDLVSADTLWKSADALRGQVDAAEYKHVVLGLLFLKYISDAYRDIPGFCKSSKIAEIGKHGFVLTPGHYVGAEEQEEDSEPFTEKYPPLLAELEAHFSEGERLTAVVREQLGRVKHGG